MTAPFRIGQKIFGFRTKMKTDTFLDDATIREGFYDPKRSDWICLIDTGKKIIERPLKQLILEP